MRYFFTLDRNAEYTCLELPDLSAAKYEAVKGIRDMLWDCSQVNGEYSDLLMRVSDESGAELFSIAVILQPHRLSSFRLGWRAHGLARCQRGVAQTLSARPPGTL